MNGTLVYTIALGNSGQTNSGTTLTVADVLPSGVTYQSAAAGTNVTSVACTGTTTLSCTVNLTSALVAGAANGAATFTITATAPSTAGSITNYASVDPTGGTTPPGPGPACTPIASCGSAPTTINTPVNITLTKSGPATAQVNGTLVYTIALGNSGQTNSGTTLTVADVLPSGVTYQSAAAGTNVTVGCVHGHHDAELHRQSHQRARRRCGEWRSDIHDHGNGTVDGGLDHQLRIRRSHRWHHAARSRSDVRAGGELRFGADDDRCDRRAAVDDPEDRSRARNSRAATSSTRSR